MKKHISLSFVLSLGLFVADLSAAQTGERAPAPAAAASQYTAPNLLARKPLLKNIDCDNPAPEDVAKCTVSTSSEGYIVKDANERTLRVFLARPEGGVQAGYFKNGTEVFRQLTASKKPSEFRWMNSAGSRWGIDDNADGVIDRWKMISAEEVSLEAVAALTSKDAQQFLRLAPAAEELATLGLNNTTESKVRQKVAQMKDGFAKALTGIGLSPKADWVQFSGGQPGIVPASKDGNALDVVSYENVSAIVRDGENHDEIKTIILGTIVKVGDNNWRLIGVPHLDDPNSQQIVADYTFYAPAAFGEVAQDGPPTPQGAGEINQIIEEIGEKQNSLAKVDIKDRAAIHEEILGLMLKCAALQSTLEDADLWIRQAADLVDGGVRGNEYPDGSRKLEILFQKVKEQFQSPEPAAYVKYKQIMAEYYQRLHNGEDNLKAIVEWMQNLEKLVEDYGKTEGAARAMLELGGYYEMMQNDNDAMKWYQKLAADMPSSDYGKRAAGAVRRIGSVGKVVPFTSKTTADAAFNLAQLKGSPVVLYFWDSYTETESAALKQLAAKYKDIKIVSIGVDDRPESLKKYLEANPLPFLQLYDTVDGISQAGQYWGLQIPPMMIYIDADGKVVRQNITNTANLLKVIEEK